MNRKESIKLYNDFRDIVQKNSAHIIIETQPSNNQNKKYIDIGDVSRLVFHLDYLYQIKSDS